MATVEDRNAFVAELREAIRTGALDTAKRQQLTEYAARLCDPLIRQAIGDDGAYHQIGELVRLQLMRAMIDGIEERNNSTQRWVIRLAVIAIVVGIAQAIAAILPYVGISPPPPTVVIQPPPTKQSAPPILEIPQASDQAIKKSP